MSPPHQHGTDTREPKWRLSLGWLLLCGLVLLGGTSPGARGELPGKPHLSLKLERFAVAGPKGDASVSIKRVDDSGDEPVDSDIPLALPPSHARVDFLSTRDRFSLVASQGLPRFTRYTLQTPRAPPVR